MRYRDTQNNDLSFGSEILPYKSDDDAGLIIVVWSHKGHSSKNQWNRATFSITIREACETSRRASSA